MGISQLIAELQEMGIIQPQVLKAFQQIPRELFVPVALVDSAYENRPLNIGHGQTISQPYIIARMLQSLYMSQKMNKVLEIGTGSGYQTALLCLLFPEVHSIERIYDLHLQAVQRLKTFDFADLHLYYGDGLEGLVDQAPFDAMILSGHIKEVPYALLAQLNPQGGCMVAPIGGLMGQDLKRIIRKDNHFETDLIEKVRFVPLKQGKS